MKPSKQRVKARRRARGSAVALLAGAALAVLPAAGDATVTNVGSDLSKPANIVEAHGADALWWNSLVDGRPGAMPADGQVTSVRVKGVVLDSSALRRNPQRPDPMFHIQALHPIGGGRVRVMLSSAPFRLPLVNVARDGTVEGNAQVINKYAPINLCVHRGDFVDFNEIGGHEWSWNFPNAIPGLDGMHFQIFSAAPGSSTPFYTKNAGTNNNSEWAPQDVRQGQELLMQVQLSTGAHATDFCPGGYMQHVFTGLQMSRQTATVSSSNSTIKVRGSCSHKIYGGCKGVVLMKATIGGREVSLGGAPFSVRSAFSSTVNVKLSSQSVAMIKKAKTVTARVRADGHDDPLHDGRAHPGVPVQHRTTFTTFTLRAG